MRKPSSTQVHNSMAAKEASDVVFVASFTSFEEPKEVLEPVKADDGVRERKCFQPKDIQKC